MRGGRSGMGRCIPSVDLWWWIRGSWEIPVRWWCCWCCCWRRLFGVRRVVVASDAWIPIRARRFEVNHCWWWWMDSNHWWWCANDVDVVICEGHRTIGRRMRKCCCRSKVASLLLIRVLSFFVE